MAIVNSVVRFMELMDLDFDFVDLVEDRLICTICTMVMKDPHLVVCCGKKYCASCPDRWIKTRPVQPALTAGPQIMERGHSNMLSKEA